MSAPRFTPLAYNAVGFPTPKDGFVSLNLLTEGDEENWRRCAVDFRGARGLMGKSRAELTYMAAQAAELGVVDDIHDLVARLLEHLVRNAGRLQTAADISMIAANRLALVSGRRSDLAALYVAYEDFSDA